MLSKPFGQSLLSSDKILFYIDINVVCFMKNVSSDSCSGIAIFIWSNTAFNLI